MHINIDKINSDTTFEDFLAVLPETEKRRTSSSLFFEESSGLRVWKTPNHKFFLKNFSSKTPYPETSNILNLIGFLYNLDLKSKEGFLQACSIFAQNKGCSLEHYLDFQTNDIPSFFKISKREVEEVPPPPFIPNLSHELRRNADFATVKERLHKKPELSQVQEGFYAYFNRWGISQEYLNRYGVEPLDYYALIKDNPNDKVYYGYSKPDCIAYICKAGGNIKAKVPARDPKEKRELYLESTGNYVFGYDQLPDHCQMIVFCAGEKDTLLLNQHFNKFGVYGICLTGEKSLINPNFYKSLQARAKTLAICYDNDETGIKSMEKYCQLLPSLVKIDIALACESITKARAKDISDLYEHGQDHVWETFATKVRTLASNYSEVLLQIQKALEEGKISESQLKSQLKNINLA